ncbi:ribosome maturation factor RimM [Pajaroellobacter abortibovis]|uniref:ribosome maturation factor RimM n=1 Tax=Pajaroellobacter abortibovis TaxID=1882918 RepID=UPI0015617751|nr:ribosome maturation factor RimM [Pajaroellobacter abortibovis]
MPLAQVVRPHGIKGELRLKLYCSSSDLLLHVRTALLRSSFQKKEQHVQIESARRVNEAILIKVQSIQGRTQAEFWKGAQLYVQRGDFLSLEEGEFYACDLEGARVFKRQGNALQEIGQVEEVYDYPTLDAILIRPVGENHCYEVPLIDSFVEEVDPWEKRVILSSSSWSVYS